jgi:hypothetical protein
MTLEEWKTFCLGKLVRILDPVGEPSFRGIVTNVKAGPSPASRMRVFLDGNYEGSDHIYQGESWYIDSDNLSTRWHVEVWTG